MRFDARAREWVEHALGPGHAVVAAQPERGGVASVVHRVRVADRNGHDQSYCLRRVPFRSEVANHHPASEVLDESDALSTVGGGPIPELVAGLDAVPDIPAAKLRFDAFVEAAAHHL